MRDQIKFVAYGSMISYNKLRNPYDPNAKQNIKQTKLYKALKLFYLPEDDIYMDVLQSVHDEREQLNLLLYGIGDAPPVLKRGDVIMIDSLKSLAPKQEIYFTWYDIVGTNKMNIMIPSSPELNTCDFHGTRVSQDKLDAITEIVEQFSPRKGRGRIPMEITDEFKKAYWQYQHYELSPDDASWKAEIGKKTFYRLIKEYEQTPFYYDDLNGQPPSIENYPKRGGELPPNFEKLLFDIENRKVSFDDACKANRVDLNSYREYIRYKNLYDQGRRKTTALQNERKKQKP